MEKEFVCNPQEVMVSFFNLFSMIIIIVLPATVYVHDVFLVLVLILGVIWCNLLPNGEVDPLLQHKANPVSEGLRKFGINVWMADCNMNELSLEKPKIVIDRKRKLENMGSALSIADHMNAKFSSSN